jgi:S-DNA-T family DNA segregation ATPase FtsK/SpoIIIE
MSGYRQIRRQARQARRAGMAPMMVINTGDTLPELAAVVIGRLLWRYRSELAPVAVLVLLAGAGLWAHAAHPGLAVPVLAISLAVACLLVWAGRLAGLVPLAERAYAGAVVLSGGAWLALAAAYGPLTPPLPLALVTGGLVLSVPWGAHRRRRARVRVARTLAAWPDISRAVGLAGSAVMSATVDTWGWRARFRLARGQTITDVIAKVPAIESGLGTFRGRGPRLPHPR